MLSFNHSLLLLWCHDDWVASFGHTEHYLTLTLLMQQRWRQMTHALVAVIIKCVIKYANNMQCHLREKSLKLDKLMVNKNWILVGQFVCCPVKHLGNSWIPTFKGAITRQREDKRREGEGEGNFLRIIADFSFSHEMIAIQISEALAKEWHLPIFLFWFAFTV